MSNVKLAAACLCLLALAAITALAAPFSSSDLTITSTVIGSFIDEGEKLKFLGLWRGSADWRLRAGSGGHSSNGGGGGGRVRQGFTYGDFTFDVDISDATNVAKIEIIDAKRIAKNLADRFRYEVSLKETNVIFVDRFDTKPTVVRMTRIDPEWSSPNPIELVYGVFKGRPDFVEFLQCDLFLASPMMQMMVPEYRDRWMAVHPCGAVPAR